MSLIDRAKLVLAALADAASERAVILGKLREAFEDADSAALLAKGSERFLASVASGDLADRGTVEKRRQACRGCPSLTVEQVEGAESPSAWCGPALRDLTTAEPPTCGCLVRLKTLVGSEKCPQDRW